MQEGFFYQHFNYGQRGEVDDLQAFRQFASDGVPFDLHIQGMTRNGNNIFMAIHDDIMLAYVEMTDDYHGMPAYNRFLLRSLATHDFALSTLLLKRHATVDFSTSVFSSALHYGGIQMIDYLLAINIDVNQGFKSDFFCMNDMTLLTYACRGGWVTSVQHLFEAGADVNVQDSNKMNVNKMNVIHLLKEYMLSARETTAVMSTCKQIISLLQAYGFNMKMLDKDTPMQVLAVFPELSKLLKVASKKRKRRSEVENLA